MSCFPCFTKKDEDNEDDSDSESPRVAKASANSNHNKGPMKKDGANGNIQTLTFTFRELATATKNFRSDCLIGEGGFGRVYKGCFQSTGQVVAVKQLDRNGLQGNKEFTVEVLMLSLLHHPNLVNLIGYCADGEQRLLVYEFMPLGSLEEHLLDLKSDKKPLDWYKRMKIAFGAAQGLEYLHEKANPPVIYRDLKPSNILLDEDYNPKLSDFGLAKLGPGGDKFNVASCVMGTYGYCAPEYARHGELTLRSDVYSFGVVLLELISGRRVIDTTRPTDEQNLVAWAQPMFRDQKRFPELVDPLLKGAYPEKGMNQAVGVAAMCLQEEAMVRPLMADIVMALSFLTEGPPLSKLSAVPSPTVNPPIPLEKPQYQPPEPVVAETMGRSRSNASHSKSSKSFRHGSSRTDSSKHFHGLREAASLSSSSVNSKLSSIGNCSNRSYSMHSIDSEEESSNGNGHSSPENATHNSCSNSRQVSVKSTASQKCEVQYFHHARSGNQIYHYDIDNYLQHNGNVPSSTSSSTCSHKESEQVFDIL